MHIIHVHIQVKPELVEEFKRVTIENASNSVQEPGVARFDVIQQADDPTRFVLVEVYRDEQAPARHRETAHYNAWKDRATDMMAEPRTRAVYSNVFPGDEGW
ncbi:MAG TPA: antibiotic biosynthesis monooxygenase [Terriglobia bacterium]|nr:antibiotic biosynthesis monooxygenase [Terriglobia bacterium]